MSFTEVQQKLFNSNLVLRFLKAVDRNERLFNEFQVSENQKETTLLPYDVTKPSANTKRRNRCGRFLCRYRNGTWILSTLQLTPENGCFYLGGMSSCLVQPFAESVAHSTGTTFCLPAIGPRQSALIGPACLRPITPGRCWPASPR